MPAESAAGRAVPDWLGARRWRLPLAAALTGALIATGQAPLGWTPLAFLALIAMLALATTVTRRGNSAWHAALIGWAAGIGYFAAALHWIVEPFLIEPELYGWLAPFGLFGLSAGLALFWALAFVVARRMGGGALRVALAVALAELARGHVLTGFPWALVGYIWSDTVFAQLGALVGPYGLTALSLGMAALPAWLWQRSRTTATLRKTVRTFSVFAAPAAVLVYTSLTLATRVPPPEALPGPILRLVQPNAPQDQKWDPDLIPVFFNRAVNLSITEPEATKPDLIVWPESALPWLLEEAAPALAYVADEVGNVPMVIGLQRSQGEAFYNSAAYVDATGTATQVYDKFHLVPFGEYMPFPEFWRRLGITGLAVRADRGYSAGPGPETFDLGFGKALPLICYEAVFPAYSRATPRPALLLQLTNDAWFGAYSGPYQHLAQARMRAIETGLPMVRAANTGVSAVIDGHGRITHALPLNTSGALDARLPPALPATPYSRIGDLPVAGVLLLLALIGICRPRRNCD